MFDHDDFIKPAKELDEADELDLESSHRARALKDALRRDSESLVSLHAELPKLDEPDSATRPSGLQGPRIDEQQIDEQQIDGQQIDEPQIDEQQIDEPSSQASEALGVELSEIPELPELDLLAGRLSAEAPAAAISEDAAAPVVEPSEAAAASILQPELKPSRGDPIPAPERLGTAEPSFDLAATSGTPLSSENARPLALSESSPEPVAEAAESPEPGLASAEASLGAGDGESSAKAEELDSAEPSMLPDEPASEAAAEAPIVSRSPDSTSVSEASLTTKSVTGVATANEGPPEAPLGTAAERASSGEQDRPELAASEKGEVDRGSVDSTSLEREISEEKALSAPELDEFEATEDIHALASQLELPSTSDAPVASPSTIIEAAAPGEAMELGFVGAEVACAEAPAEASAAGALDCDPEAEALSLEGASQAAWAAAPIAELSPAAPRSAGEQSTAPSTAGPTTLSEPPQPEAALDQPEPSHPPGARPISDSEILRIPEIAELHELDALAAQLPHAEAQELPRSEAVSSALGPSVSVSTARSDPKLAASPGESPTPSDANKEAFPKPQARSRPATLRYELDPRDSGSRSDSPPAAEASARKRRKGGTRVDLVAISSPRATVIPPPPLESALDRDPPRLARRDSGPVGPLVFGSAGVAPPIVPPPRPSPRPRPAPRVESEWSAEATAESKKSRWMTLLWVILTLVALAPMSVLIWVEWRESQAQSLRQALERAVAQEDWETALQSAEALLAIEPESELRSSQIRDFRIKLKRAHSMNRAKTELATPAPNLAARVQQGQRAFELAPDWSEAAEAWLSALEDSAFAARAKGDFEAEQQALRRAFEALQAIRARSIPGFELDLRSARLRHRVRAEDESLHETQISRDLEAAARGDANAAEPIFARALLAERRGDLRSALQLYQAALVRDPKARWALLRRAELLRRDRSIAAAREDLRHALELTKDFEALCLRGHLRLGEGEHETARQDLNEALALAPGCVRAAALLFRFDPLELRQPAEAESIAAELSKLAAVDPLDPWPLLILAELWIVGPTQDPDEALRLLGQALRLDPNLAELHYWRGRAEQMLDARAEAMSAYDRCLLLDPRNPFALANRAVLHRQNGQHDKAISDVEAAGRLAPNDARVSFQRAKVRWEVLSVDRVDWSDPQWDRVVELLQLSCKQDPSMADVYGRLAYLYERRGRSNEALANYDKAVSYSSSGYWAGIRGLYLTRVKRYSEALEDFKAFEKNPSSSSNPALFERIANAREHCETELGKGSGE